MNKISPILLLVLSLAAAGAVRAEVLTFDDLVDDRLWQSTAMPTEYGGLYWVGWNYYSWENYPYSAHSGDTRLLHQTMWPPSKPSPNAIYSDSPATPFSFDGAWFAGYSSFDYPKSVSFELYRNGELVHQSEWLTPTSTSTFLASGYSGAIDRVVVLGDVSFAAMDDFQFHFISSVPEPETYAMMFAGLALIALRGRKRRLQAQNDGAVRML